MCVTIDQSTLGFQLIIIRYNIIILDHNILHIRYNMKKKH